MRRRDFLRMLGLAPVAAAVGALMTRTSGVAGAYVRLRHDEHVITVDEMPRHEGYSLISWAPVRDPDFDGYEVRRGTDWEDAREVVRTNRGTTMMTVRSTGQEHHHMIRARRSDGSYCGAPTHVYELRHDMREI